MVLRARGQIGGFGQMPDRCRIRTSERERFFHRGAHPLMPVLFNQTQHLDHLARAALLAVPGNQFGQQAIVTLRPQPALTPRRQRLRSDQRSRLALQHVKIMFEIQHLLMAFVTAFMPRDAATFIAHFHADSDRAGPRPSAHSTGTEYRLVRTRTHPRPSTRGKEISASSNSLLGQRQQMRAFLDHQRSHRPIAPSDLTSFVGATGGEQLGVEVIEIARFRQRHPVIAPEVAGFAFDPALGTSCRMQMVRLMRSDFWYG